MVALPNDLGQVSETSRLAAITIEHANSAEAAKPEEASKKRRKQKANVPRSKLLLCTIVMVP